MSLQPVEKRQPCPWRAGLLFLALAECLLSSDHMYRRKEEGPPIKADKLREGVQGSHGGAASHQGSFGCWGAPALHTHLLRPPSLGVAAASGLAAGGAEAPQGAAAGTDLRHQPQGSAAAPLVETSTFPPCVCSPSSWMRPWMSLVSVGTWWRSSSALRVVGTVPSWGCVSNPTFSSRGSVLFSLQLMPSSWQICLNQAAVLHAPSPPSRCAPTVLPRALPTPFASAPLVFRGGFIFSPKSQSLGCIFFWA